jgi:hypothetical protein
LIVGITQGLSYSALNDMPLFELRTKTHPFLHSILLHLLRLHPTVVEATQVAQKYSGIPFFTHSLELLLHLILEDSLECRTPERKGSKNLVESV